MLAVIIGAIIIALVAFLIYRNMKDKKKFEKDLNERDEHPSHMPVEEEKHL